MSARDGTFNISRQLAKWMKIRGKTLMDVTRFLNPGGGSQVVDDMLTGDRWVTYKTIARLAEFFKTTPNKFYGGKLECGEKKVLEMLNSEDEANPSFGDYLAGDGPMVRLNQREWQLEYAESIQKRQHDGPEIEAGR